ncbi:MAG: ThiF family adenylyltransferase [Candidatus Tectomicrobia bacterium]|nr:ThiF family adenylyltransferase [Candidatus Tectomicrobia bacterium]
MKPWFLRDMQRLSLEREAIKRLEETAEWLKGTDWVFGDGLCVDAIIRAHGHDYQVRLSYPALFPFAPPVVRPKNPNERWSSHQYLNGTLCLEWGPDTWHPDVTGAQVLESVYKLLYIENPFGSDEHKVAPSRHHFSIGQTLRDIYGRFYAGDKLSSYLATLPPQAVGSVEFLIQWQSKSFLVLIQKIRSIGMQPWEDISLPQGVRASEDKGILRAGIFYKTGLDCEIINRINSAKEIEDTLNRVGYRVVSFSNDEIDPAMGLKRPPFGILLLDSTDKPHFFILFDPNKDKVLQLAPVQSENDGVLSRTPTDLQELSGKSVGIVGLGSVGSKLAISLARMGVSRFFLIDEDIFLPENVCRHVLDWQNIGEHKVDAIAEILHRIAPNIEVDVSHLHLTGQESTASLRGALNRLGLCDLLIDATADSHVFNLMAAVATTYEKPLVWGEVYAGGIGGMIARSRPGRDPDPHSMRAVYNHFTSEIQDPRVRVADDYTAESNAGDIVSASDADVSILAYHAARLAIDTLLKREPSIFPYSMYLIGLARSWIFKAPFDTIPIATDHLLQKQSSDPLTDEGLSNNVEFLTNLIKKTKADAGNWYKEKQ